MKKISIIIPIYNSEKFLKKCLDSIIKQTYKNIEIICVNDGSTDSSINILDKYKKKDNRIIIIDKKNEGVSSARNDGIKKATGEYIAFVDADDWLELDAIEALYNAITKQQVDVVRANYYINYDYNTNINTGSLYNLGNRKLLTSDSDFAKELIDKLLNGKIPCYTGLLLIRKDLLRNISFKKEIKLMEDTIFYLELMNEINSIYILDKPIYHYFFNENSCTKSSEFYIRNMYNIIKVNKYITDIIKNSKFNNDGRLKLINSSHISFLTSYFFDMYKYSTNSNSEIIEEIDKLLNNKDFISILYSANLSSLPIHIKISIKLIKSRRYKLLIIFYKLRKTLSILKDRILNRK